MFDNKTQLYTIYISLLLCSNTSLSFKNLLLHFPVKSFWAVKMLQNKIR